MILFLKIALAVFQKDLLSEMRKRERLNTLLFFGIVIIFMFSFALGKDPEQLSRMAAGLLWLVILFSSVLALDRSFATEVHEGCLDRMVLFCPSLRAVFVGKFLGNFLVIFLTAVATLFFMFLLFGLNAPRDFPLLAATLLLGTVGIAGIGTFYAALLAHTRARASLLPLLLFPMLTPLLLAAVFATKQALEGDLTGVATWVKLLGIFDLTFLTGSLMAIEPVLES